MSLEKLLRITNSDEFYQDSHFKLVNIIADNNTYKSVIFNFVNEYSVKTRKNDIEKWQIVAHRCERFHNMFQENYMPFIQLKIFTDHPLLWQYKSKILECELIGYPEDVDTFLGQLYQAYIKVSNNWIQATQNFYATEYSYKENEKKNLRIPENLKDCIIEICKNHKIVLEVKKTIEPQNSIHKNLKVLIFGNDYISPDGFNINQPYIIAYDFFAKEEYSH